MPNKIKFKSGAHYVYATHYHLIWCTKYRNQIFTNQTYVQDLKAILLSEANAHSIEIERIEVMPEHVHLLVSFPPRISGSDVIRILKGRSAFLFLQAHPEVRKQKCWGNHLWSDSYLLTTLGNMSKDIVEKYIENQKYNKTRQ